jgi:hypothetical protein
MTWQDAQNTGVSVLAMSRGGPKLTKSPVAAAKAQSPMSIVQRLRFVAPMVSTPLLKEHRRLLGLNSRGEQKKRIFDDQNEMAIFLSDNARYSFDLSQF